MLTPELEHKWSTLKAALTHMERVAVAFSGGVDSSLVLAASVHSLGPSNVLAVTVASPVHPQSELEEAQRFAASLGVTHFIVKSDELSNEAFVQNPPDRCYICKFGRFDHLREIAQSRGFPFILDGGNVDDLHDHRPGERAARELGVRSPLREAGLTKSDIRALAREMGLANWDQPSRACLASRFPYGERITAEGLQRIEAAEKLLAELGIRQRRVRHHQTVARIEVPLGDFARVLANRERIVSVLKELGFAYVTLDLAGFRSGSMNEVL